MSRKEITIFEQQIKELTRVIKDSNLTIVRTVNGAGAPVALKTIIHNLKLNTYFEVESPKWFDFESLDEYYANRNDAKRDLYVFVIDRDSHSAELYRDGYAENIFIETISYPFSQIKEFIEKNKQVKVVVLSCGVTLTGIRNDVDYTRFDFPKLI